MLERIGLPKTFQSWQDIMEFNLSDENLLPLDAVDFGVQFRLALFEANGISDLAEQDMKRRCRDYMLELSKEIRKRLPDNIKQLEALKFLSPSHTLSSSKPRIDDLPFFHLFKGDVGKAEQQWRVIHTLEWNNAEDGKTEDFWVEVSAYTDTAEQPQIWREKHQTEVLRREKEEGWEDQYLPQSVAGGISQDYLKNSNLSFTALSFLGPQELFSVGDLHGRTLAPLTPLWLGVKKFWQQLKSSTCQYPLDKSIVLNQRAPAKLSKASEARDDRRSPGTTTFLNYIMGKELLDLPVYLSSNMW
ncbi:Zinc finger MYM-type 1 [Labeo rohita]|uniref:Zinc finger MYM-type 1 n=1 Tax=Labeo rohita TaxID=84645 RepID=A0A498MTF7_LABRO|nr:Zinc finger MYM-type 1 [Labeo rohita]